MPTYSQWARSRPLRQVTWVCGPEPVLVREVTRHFRASLPDAVWAVLWAGDQDEGGLWDSLLGAGALRGRVTVVHDAQLLRRSGDLVPVLLDSLPEGHFAVFVSAGLDFPRVSAEKKAPLVPYLEDIRAHRDGQLVRCCPPSRDEELLKLVASWWPGAGLNFAASLWARCGQSLTAAWQACDQAARASLAPTQEYLEYVLPVPEDSFWASLVMSGDRARSVSAAARLSHAEALQAVKSLNTLLAQACAYAKLKARSLEPDEIARHGITRPQQRELARYAARYSPAREVSCRVLLATAEQALRSGASAGALEAVAALW